MAGLDSTDKIEMEETVAGAPDWESQDLDVASGLSGFRRLLLPGCAFPKCKGSRVVNRGFSLVPVVAGAAAGWAEKGSEAISRLLVQEGCAGRF